MRPSTLVRGIGLLGDKAGDSCPRAAPLKKKRFKKNIVIMYFFNCSSPGMDLGRFTRFQAISRRRRTATPQNRLAEACWAMTYTGCLLWCGSPEEAGSCCLLPPRPEHVRYGCSDRGPPAGIRR